MACNINPEINAETPYLARIKCTVLWILLNGSIAIHFPLLEPFFPAMIPILHPVAQLIESAPEVRRHNWVFYPLHALVTGTQCIEWILAALQYFLFPHTPYINKEHWRLKYNFSHYPAQKLIERWFQNIESSKLTVLSSHFSLMNYCFLIACKTEKRPWFSIPKPWRFFLQHPKIYAKDCLFCVIWAND